MRHFALLVLGFALTAGAIAQTPASQPAAAAAADPLLGKPFRSRIAGIQFNPPAGGAMIRDLNSGDIVRFVYSDESWDVRAKPIPLHVPLQLSLPPDAGVLELSASHLTDSNPTAVIVRKEVIHLQSKKDVGVIEATYKAGTDGVFAQQAIFRESDQQYFSLQMTSGDKPADQDHARNVFQHMLETVQLLDRNELLQEQLRRVLKTRGLWLLLDKKAMMATIQPLHFMRVVRDGRDVGVIQINERPATHNGNDGIEIIIHSNVEVELGTAPAAMSGPQLPAPETTGIVLPKSIAPSTAPTTQEAGPQGLYTYAVFFVSFDRNHEDWTSITQTDRNIDTQITEDATSDNTIHHKPDPQQRNKILDVPDYVLNVTYEVGHAKGLAHKQASLDRKLTPFYLPQALGQLLPRLLPTDEAGQYMFAFYVSGQRDVMGRYVDVQTSRDVVLDGQTVRAVPITDRIGADGISTTHYVNRNGEWLGSVSEDSRLQVFPTDEHTLKGLWPGFAVAPEPPPFGELPKPDNPPAGPVMDDKPLGPAGHR